MARIAPRILKFDLSPDQNIVEYRVRVLPDGQEFDYELDYDVIPGPGVNLASLSQAPTTDGIYDIYITAAEASGNESDPLEVPDAVLDFTAPLPPTNGELI